MAHDRHERAHAEVGPAQRGPVAAVQRAGALVDDVDFPRQRGHVVGPDPFPFSWKRQKLRSDSLACSGTKITLKFSIES